MRPAAGFVAATRFRELAHSWTGRPASDRRRSVGKARSDLVSKLDETLLQDVRKYVYGIARLVALERPQQDSIAKSIELANARPRLALGRRFASCRSSGAFG
jgi:hypothetical protein